MLSYQYVTKNGNCKLVHGYITDKFGGTGRVIDHAWVEMGNTAFDTVLNKKYNKKVYYSLFGVELPIIYDRMQAYEQAAKFGTYGPWHRIDKNKIKFP